MNCTAPDSSKIFIALILACVNMGPAAAQTAAGKNAAGVTEIKLGYLRAYEPRLALSVLDIPPRDEGVAGAEVAIGDNNTTGKFLGQSFALDIAEVRLEADVTAVFNGMIEKGERYILADISAKQLLSIADIARDKGVLLFNVGATDDILREEECRINVFHTAPTRTMLADGLAQYLIWKQWRRWVLLYGSHEPDQLFADALRRAATRFGGEIVAEKLFADTGTARRTDSGVVQIQRQMPVFTQDLPEHDVVLVADESEVFGTYVPNRTWIPRPVAGTAGLIPTAGIRPASNGAAPDPEPVCQGERAAHAVQRYGRVDSRPHHRRRRHPHKQRRSAEDQRFHRR